jgi:DNA-binding transcriptional LysR family regulator
LKSAQGLWAKDRIDEPLICLPEHESICKNFQQGLNRAGVDWFPSLEVSSIDLVETYVANGFGVGLSVFLPQGRNIPEIRALPLVGIFARRRRRFVARQALHPAPGIPG